MISVKNVNKNFGSLSALKEVSFDIAPGEIVGFLGKNGAGKTTLMRILTSYLSKTSGEVNLFGQDIEKKSLMIRQKIGYLSESLPLYSHMTVFHYLRFCAQIKDIAQRQQKAQVERVLDLCQIKNVAHKRIGVLSKGYKQRIGIAQAIIHEPELLILDEPTNGLDPTQVKQVRSLIKNLECQRTVLLSTHILSEIELLAKRVLIIKQGQIVADDSLKNLLSYDENWRDYVVRVHGEKENIEQAIKMTHAVKFSKIQLREGFLEVNVRVNKDLKDNHLLVQNIMEKGGRLLSLFEQERTLEEVFLNYHQSE